MKWQIMSDKDNNPISLFGCVQNLLIIYIYYWNKQFII